MISLARKFIGLFAALCCLALLGISASAATVRELKPFTAASLGAIKQAQQNKPFILAFWSLHCAPCKEDMAILAAVHAKHPKLAIILVATDKPDDHAAVSRFLAEQKLGRIEQWAFADSFEERIRFAVDKEWHGELPRSYLFDSGHRAEAQSGVLDQKALDAWVARAMKPRG